MFSSIRTYWLNAIEIGSSDDLSYQQNIRLQTVNEVAVISIFLVLLFSLVFTLMESYNTRQSLPVAGVMMVVIWFNLQHLFERARASMAIFIDAVIPGIAVIDRCTGTEYLQLATACSSFLIQLKWIATQKGKELQSYLDTINVHIYLAVAITMESWQNRPGNPKKQSVLLGAT